MEQELEPSAAAGLDTDMSSESASDASDTSEAQAGHEDQAHEEQTGANWYALEIARLKRSIGAAKTLIAGLKAAKKLIVKLAPVFAQDAKQVEIGSKAASAREKLLALADAACLPEHPIRRGFDAVLGQPDEMDTAVNAHALPIRNHVLEPFEALLNSVLHPDQADAASADVETSEASEATEEGGAPPAKIDAAEFLETLDIRLKEWGLVRKQLAADLRKLRFKRLLSGRTLAIACALLLIGGAATGAYFLTRPGPSKPAAAAQGAVKQGAEQRAAAVAPPQPAAPAAPAAPATSAATAAAAPAAAPQAIPPTPTAVPVGAVAIAPVPTSPPASATASAASAAASMASASASATASASAIAAQPSAADKTASASAPAEPIAKAPPPPPPTPEAYKRSGLTTIVNGKDKAAIKQNVQQLGEVIKIWNEQIEQAAKEGKK